MLGLLGVKTHKEFKQERCFFNHGTFINKVKDMKIFRLEKN